MRIFIFTLCCFLSFSNIAWSRCSSFAKEAGLLKKTADAICEVIPGTNTIKVATCGSVDKAKNLTKEVTKWWNDVSNNGPSSIGPRTYSLNTEDHGKIIVPAGRLWVSQKPLRGDKKVKISYRDGKAGAMVDICKVDAKGKVKFLGYIDIPKKSKKGGSKTITVKDGGWLMVDMRGKGGLAKSYSYGIEISN